MELTLGEEFFINRIFIYRYLIIILIRIIASLVIRYQTSLSGYPPVGTRVLRNGGESAARFDRAGTSVLVRLIGLQRTRLLRIPNTLVGEIAHVAGTPRVLAARLAEVPLLESINSRRVREVAGERRQGGPSGNLFGKRFPDLEKSFQNLICAFVVIIDEVVPGETSVAGESRLRVANVMEGILSRECLRQDTVDRVLPGQKLSYGSVSAPGPLAAGIFVSADQPIPVRAGN